MKYLIIVNPISGRGFAGRSIPRIETGLKAQDLEYDLVLTEKPWHAADLAESGARSGYDVVVTASGDGTANEAINGLMHARAAGFNQTAMSIIPVGTGNDMAYGMGLRGDLEQSIATLAKNRRQIIDVGLVTGGDYPQGRYFANGVGIGFDAAVGFAAVQIRWARGLPAYLIAVIQTVFFYYQPPRLSIQLDDESFEQPSLMVSIMNGQRMGGGFYMAPEGLPGDGIFDLCIADSASKPRIFGLIPHFIKGSQATQKEIKMKRSRQATIQALPGYTFPAHCDGETLCYAGEKISIQLIPQALEFVTDLS